MQLDMRKFNFAATVKKDCFFSVWNSLPDSVVSADTVDAFKIRLDR